jgi:hypothetical protein
MGVENTIDTNTAVELVTAAWELYRKNGWTENRADRVVVNEPLTIDDMVVNPLLVTVRDNAFAHMGVVKYDDANPMDIKLDITDAIREKAASDSEVIVHNGVMRALMDSNVDDFTRTIVDLLKEPVIKTKSFNALCYINGLANRVRAQQEIDEIMSFAVDEYAGNFGTQISMTVTVLKTSYRQEWQTYNHICINGDGQLVSFMYKLKQEHLATFNIIGKVKEHRYNWQRQDLKETRLNYVKII